MKILYIDNFRGFYDTYIPIEDVNFLVGENSTGKSSILGLLKLINSSSFWFENKFDSPEVNFGHFSDIVSVCAEDKSFFSVGFIETKQDDDSSNEIISSFLITFVERDGIPKPLIYISSAGQTEYRIRFTANQIKYKKSVISNCGNSKDFINHNYREWTNAHITDNKGYTFFPNNDTNLKHVPPVFLCSLIDQLEGNEKAPLLPRGHFPNLGHEIAWLAPIRTKPRRTYDEYKFEFNPEGEHTPYVIKKLLDKKHGSKSFKDFLSRTGKESGLFEAVDIKKFGKGSTAPFELDVIINNKALSVNNVGYGVSQALPVIVELSSRRNNSWLAIQQPEVHLHPRAQAALGDIFFEVATKDNKKLLIETHSDYSIDRFRSNIKKTSTHVKAQILYFERSKKGNKVHQITINEKGELPENQPKGYRDFFIKEELNILGF